MKRRIPQFVAIALPLLAALGWPAPSRAITPQQQTTIEQGVVGGYAWSSSITLRQAGNDTVTFSTHACGPVTVSYARELKYNAACVLEDCQQSYLGDVLNGAGDDPAAACAAGDSVCCSRASSGLAHCLTYPNSYCLN